MSLWMNLSSINVQSDNLAQFTHISKIILEKKVRLKKRYARYNQAKFMNKNFQKAIMNRSKFNRYKKKKTEASSFLFETTERKDLKQILK